MRINTNIASMAAQEAVSNTNKGLTNSLEKLGTGLRINKAADDASGLAIADKLRTQASSIGQGIANANSASALIQIADKAMSEQSNILDIIKTKLIQAGTATTSPDGRESIRKDIQKLLEQFDNIASQTNYNGVTLLQKDATTTTKQDNLIFQMGEEKDFDIIISPTAASNTKSMGGGADAITTGTNIEPGEALNLVDTDASITLATKRLSESGAEIISGTDTGKLNITFTGNLGTVSATTGGTSIDLSGQTQAVKDLMLAYIGTTTGVATDPGSTIASYDTATDLVTFISSSAVDLSSIDLSGATITNAKAMSVSTLTIANSAGFSVTNNLTAGSNENFIDVTSAGTMLGGSLLSSISALGEDELTSAKANTFMSTIDEAMIQLNLNRADFGSSQNQIESSVRNMKTAQVNIKAAESVIRDVDYAAESANFNKMNIISQAGTYAISQANNVQQNVMKLLQ